MLAVKELSESSASSLTVVRARWSCRALTVTWAYTAPPAGTHIHTHSHQYPHITHLHTSLMDYSTCDSQVIYPCTPPSPSSSQFLAPPLFISLGLSLMARVNWLLSNCCSLAWVTKHVRRNKQKLPPLARLCAGFFFFFCNSHSKSSSPPPPWLSAHLPAFVCRSIFHFVASLTLNWKTSGRQRWGGWMANQTNPHSISAFEQYLKSKHFFMLIFSSIQYQFIAV